jgi:hypothetical protein
MIAVAVQSTHQPRPHGRCIISAGAIRLSLSHCFPVSRASCSVCVQIVIASFQDAYHVRTLHDLLDTCQQLEVGVEVHEIMSLLMERLAEYAKNSDEAIFASDSAFDAFLDAAHGCGVKCASALHCSVLGVLSGRYMQYKR